MDQDFRLVVGNFFRDADETDLARVHLEKSVEICNTDARAHHALARLYEDIDEEDLAETHYRESIRYEDSEVN